MTGTIDTFARAIVGALGTGMLAAGALAVCAWFVVRSLRPSATTQHALWWIVLCAAAALPVASAATSFARIEHHAAPRAKAPALPRLHAVPASGERGTAGLTRDVETKAASASPDRVRRLAAFDAVVRGVIDRPGFATVLVAIWLAVAALRTLALGHGLLALMRIKHAAIALDETVVRKLRRFRYGMRTGRAVTIFSTPDIDVPVAVGFGKPAILLPSFVAEHEAIADLDQIVMHEYAHLNRYDDVTNFVQCLLEATFWFNPVLAVAARQLSLQREIACDDSVVAQTGRAHRYATCLWRLVESARLPSRRIVAPGALFTPKQITTRIEQLLDSRRNALPRLSPITALALAFVTAVAMFVVANRAPVIAVEDAVPERFALATPAATPSPVPNTDPAPHHAGAADVRIDTGATPEAIANAVVDATMKRSLLLEQHERHRQDGSLEKAAAALGTGIGLDIARQVSERLAPNSEWPQIERSLAHANDRAQREIADRAEQGPTGGVHRRLPSFHRILVEGSYDVEIRRGPHASVDFQDDATVASHTYTDVSGGTLSISQSDGSYNTVDPKTILVYVPSFDGVEIDRSANVRVPNASGKQLTVRISGSGNFLASGSIGNADVTIEGSGDADLLGLHATSMHVTTEGSGDVKLVAPSTLSIRIEGSGGVGMRGTPRHIDSEINGSGSIEKI